MLPVKVSLDRLVLIYKNVTLEEYDSFITHLQSHNGFYPKTVVKLGMSSGFSAYRYNINFGFGEGAIRVDYHHNSLDPTIKRCDLRIEFNPAKLKYQWYEYESLDVKKKTRIAVSKPSEWFFKILNGHFTKTGQKNPLTGEFTGHVRCVRELDIAFDFDVPDTKMVVMSMTGKEHNFYKGTHYWGVKHTHLYAKRYNKKKERQKERNKKNRTKFQEECDSWVDEYEELTRFEITLRFEGDMGYGELSRIKEWDVNDSYKVSILDENKLEKIDSVVKAHLLCYLNGLMELNEMTKTYKRKTKEAHSEMMAIDFDAILKKDFKEKIIQVISNYIRL